MYPGLVHPVFSGLNVLTLLAGVISKSLSENPNLFKNLFPITATEVKGLTPFGYDVKFGFSKSP